MADGSTPRREANPDAVCFDLDDTLYDYQEYARTGLEAAADRLAARTGESYRRELLDLYFDEGVTSGTFDRLLERRALDLDVDDETIVAELVEAYHDATADLAPYPETEPVLSGLADRFDLGLITDGRGGRAKLRRLGIEEYFDVVVVSPELDSSKRQRDVFDAALAELCGPATKTVYVGDDPRVDFRVPNRLGMVTVRLRRGRYTGLEADGEAGRPDVEIDDLQELPTLLE